MLVATRIITDQEPNKIEYLNDGSYYYNYDRKQFVGEEGPMYSFVQVHIWGHPNYKDCVRAVIRSYITIDEEFDLINSMNGVALGLVNESTEEYIEYINLLGEIKSKVKEDFKN